MTPIVLVPGLLCTAEMFAAQVPALWPHGPVTVASTLGGDTMEAIAASILAHAPPRFALAGFSMGGYVAFEMLRQAGERVERLALLSTSARPDLRVQAVMRRAMLQSASEGDFEEVLGNASMNTVHRSRRQDAVLAATKQRMAAAIGRDGFARQTHATIERIDSRPGLAAIAVPTLVLVGDSDPVTPPDCSQELAAAIPGARLVVLPECGHSCTLECPDAVNAALLDWLAA